MPLASITPPTQWHEYIRSSWLQASCPSWSRREDGAGFLVEWQSYQPQKRCCDHMAFIQRKDTGQFFYSLKGGGWDNPVNLETALHPGMCIDFFSFSSESECCRASMQSRINKTRVLYYRQHKTYFWGRVGDWKSGTHRMERLMDSVVIALVLFWEGPYHPSVPWVLTVHCLRAKPELA